MSRLFTFGCSFTQYWRWLTWADIAGKNFEFYENWGICGAGNSLIFYSLVECHQLHNINKDDTVYIMWSNTSREDRYVNDRWVALGNIFWDNGNQVPVEYVKKFACERGYLVRDLALITAALHLLKSIGCNFKFMSMVPFTAPNAALNLGNSLFDRPGSVEDVLKFYQSTLEQILPSIYEVVFNFDWSSRKGLPDLYDSSQRDFHPTPQEHLQYIQTILPTVAVSESTISWVVEVTQQAQQNKLMWNQPNRPRHRL